VAAKVLDITSKAKFLDNINQVSDSLVSGLESVKERYSEILVEIRRKGLFMGLKMSDIGYGPLMSIAGYNCGVFAVYADNDHSVLQFLPPLIIGKDEVDYITDAMDKAYAYAKERPDYLELARNLAM